MSLELTKRETRLLYNMLNHEASEEYFQNLRLEAEEVVFEKNSRDIHAFSQEVGQIEKALRLDRMVAANLKNKLRDELVLS